MIIKSLKEIADMINESVANTQFSDIIINGICIDSRKAQKGNLFIPIKGENTNGHRYIQNAVENGCTAALWDKNEPNPPSNIGIIPVDDTVKAMQDLAKAYRNTINPYVIGISGSNGKTSTKDILAGVLSTKFKTQKTLGNHNNELGVPLTILSLDEDVEVCVIEMGLEKKGDLLFLKDMVKPNIGILTNVGSAHLENFNNANELAKAKLEMLECVTDNGIFIYNNSDELFKQEIKNCKINDTLTIKKFGFDSDSDIYFDIKDELLDSIVFDVHGEVEGNFTLNMLGKHQALNAMPALIIAKHFGIDNDMIQKGFNQIQKTGLRNELVIIKKCTILNDTYKSNPESVLAALDTFEAFKGENRVVVLGDMLGLGDNAERLHREIGEKLKNYTIDELVLYGPLSEYIKETAQNHISEIKKFDTKEAMTDYLAKYLDEDSLMMIKASRDIALDEVVDALKLK